jgi:cytochrome c5
MAMALAAGKAVPAPASAPAPPPAPRSPPAPTLVLHAERHASNSATGFVALFSSWCSRCIDAPVIPRPRPRSREIRPSLSVRRGRPLLKKRQKSIDALRSERSRSARSLNRGPLEIRQAPLRGRDPRRTVSRPDLSRRRRSAAWRRRRAGSFLVDVRRVRARPPTGERGCRRWKDACQKLPDDAGDTIRERFIAGRHLYVGEPQKEVRIQSENLGSLDSLSSGSASSSLPS